MKTRWWIWQQWCFINWWVEANMFVDVVWVVWIMLDRVWLRENLKKLDLWKEDCQDQCRCWHVTNICLSFFCQVYRRWLPICCIFMVKITKKSSTLVRKVIPTKLLFEIIRWYQALLLDLLWTLQRYMVTAHPGAGSWSDITQLMAMAAEWRQVGWFVGSAVTHQDYPISYATVLLHCLNCQHHRLLHHSHPEDGILCDCSLKCNVRVFQQICNSVTL